MYKLARGGRLASSFAMSVFVVAVLLAPGQAAAEPVYNLAVGEMIEDITLQATLAAAIAGGPVSTGTTGVFSIAPDGSSYSFSFTAGGVAVTDTSTFVPDGVAPGTGTWTNVSNLTTSGSTQVTFDPSTSTYTGTMDLKPRIVPIPPKLPEGFPQPPANAKDIGVTWADFPGKWTDVAYWTDANGNAIQPPIGFTTLPYLPPPPAPDKMGTITETYTDSSGRSLGGVTVNLATDTFTANITGIPEPGSATLLVIGMVMAAAAVTKKHATRARDLRGS
jgi:hypothetical protein